MKSFLREIKLVTHSLRDLMILLLPDFSSKSEYKYAFLVHPRNIYDVYRKYPLLKKFNPRIVESALKFYWPVILSRITGLSSLQTGRDLRGFVMTIPLTAHQMMENRDLAVRKIIQAVKFAKKNGAKMVGLGGLTSSLTKGGIDIVEKVNNINVTTGHAYTAFNVTQNLFKLADLFEINKKEVLIAIVGAAGSVGSTSAKLIARKGFSNILLIDLERKKAQFANLIGDIKKINSNVNVSTSHQIGDIKNADFIIAATNAPEALIRSEDLKSGAVVIDDAQPSDVSPEALKREDVLVVEAGIVHTPNILSHFNFNLKDKHDNFCCLAEVLILASLEHDDHYVINRASICDVDNISSHASKLGFRLAEFQNFNESIKLEKLANIKRIIKP